MRSNIVLNFVVASSLPVTVWPLLGLAIAVHRNGATFDFSIAAILLPLMFGIYHVLTKYLGMAVSRTGAFITGALLGLILSATGTFILNLPETVYGLTGPMKYLALVGGPIYYSLVWGVVLWPLEKHLLRR